MAQGAHTLFTYFSDDTATCGLPAKPMVASGVPTPLAVDEWRQDMATTHDVLTVRQYAMYGRTHWATDFPTIPCFTTERIKDHTRRRLAAVLDDTHEKELSAMRSFLVWCKDHRLIDEVPLVEAPPKRATGTPDTRRRHKREAVLLEDRESEALIAALPVYSPGSRNGYRGFPVRARMAVAYQTGLRPATLDELRAPDDYHRGAATMRIRDEIDKNRFGRELPLTDEARAALDSVCPPAGLLFGRHDYREHLKRAAQAVLPADKAALLSVYDLRHSRLTYLCERTTNLPGVAYLSGHRRIDTLVSRYVHPSMRAAVEVIRLTSKQLSFDDYAAMHVRRCK